MEQAQGVGAAADAGHQQIRQAAGRFQALAAGLLADDRLEIPHHGRVRMRPGHGADDVVRVVNAGHPVAQRLVHGVLEGFGTGMHGHQLGAQELHAIHIERLALDILAAHVDLAGHSQPGGDRGRGHAVLPGARFGDHAALAHAPGQQRLADAVVHLVGAGVVQILPLEVDARPAQGGAQALGMVQGGGTAHIVFQIAGQFGLKFRVGLGFGVGFLELIQGMHEGFRHEPPAVAPEMPVRRGLGVVATRARHCAPPARSAASCRHP